MELEAQKEHLLVNPGVVEHIPFEVVVLKMHIIITAFTKTIKYHPNIDKSYQEIQWSPHKTALVVGEINEQN